MPEHYLVVVRQNRDNNESLGAPAMGEVIASLGDQTNPSQTQRVKGPGLRA